MDRRIDERFRKPRRTKGTPFFHQRNYWAAGILALSGLYWIGSELTPGVKRAKAWLYEHTKNSEEYNASIRQKQLSLQSPAINRLIVQVREKVAYDNEPVSKFSQVFTPHVEEISPAENNEFTVK